MEDTDKLIKLATVVGKLKQQVSELTSTTETIVKLEGPQGPKGDKGERGQDGKDGRDGRDGQDGRPGADGQDGADGADGVGVVGAEVALDNSLVLRLSDGSEIDAGQINVQGKGDGQTILKQQYAGPRIYVQTEEPIGASPGDLWYQI